jgi:DNA-directed RNA polymerase specialized sigma24 family protein
MASAFEPGFERERDVARAPSLEERVLQHRGALRACARRLLADDAEADAVVEEVLAYAPRALALFRPAGSLGGWLQGVTVGAALARSSAERRSAPPGSTRDAPTP